MVTGPWPSWEDERAAGVRAIARKKVADLAGDERLLEVLARACAAAAAAEYAELTQRPGIAFTLPRRT